jgi:hypothetical protein
MAAEAIAEAPTLVEVPSTAAPVKAPEVKPVAESAKGGKPEKAKKGKKGKDVKADAAEAGGEPSIAEHPRAARAVGRAKGWGGLFGFLLGGYLSLPTATFLDAGLRALLAGVVCYVVAWAGAVFAWRRLVVIEIKAREQQLITAAQRRESGGAPAVERAGARAAT